MDNDFWMIAATLLSPVIAVQVSVFIQDRKEKRERRFEVFRSLMANRAASLSPAHVEALNMIDVAFHGTDRDSRSVVEAVRVYLEHLNKNTSAPGWEERRQELLVDLLQKMAISLDYDMDKVSISRTSYFPMGYVNNEMEWIQIRTALLDVLSGRRAIPITVPSTPAAPAPAAGSPGQQAKPALAVPESTGQSGSADSINRPSS
jgi:hypothetical protein